MSSPAPSAASPVVFKTPHLPLPMSAAAAAGSSILDVQQASASPVLKKSVQHQDMSVTPLTTDFQNQSVQVNEMLANESFKQTRFNYNPMPTGGGFLPVSQASQMQGVSPAKQGDSQQQSQVTDIADIEEGKGDEIMDFEPPSASTQMGTQANGRMNSFDPSLTSTQLGEGQGHSKVTKSKGEISFSQREGKVATPMTIREKLLRFKRKPVSSEALQILQNLENENMSMAVHKEIKTDEQLLPKDQHSDQASEGKSEMTKESATDVSQQLHTFQFVTMNKTPVKGKVDAMLVNSSRSNSPLLFDSEGENAEVIDTVVKEIVGEAGGLLDMGIEDELDFKSKKGEVNVVKKESPPMDLDEEFENALNDASKRTVIKTNVKSENGQSLCGNELNLQRENGKSSKPSQSRNRLSVSRRKSEERLKRDDVVVKQEIKEQKPDSDKENAERLAREQQELIRAEDNQQEIILKQKQSVRDETCDVGDVDLNVKRGRGKRKRNTKMTENKRIRGPKGVVFDGEEEENNAKKEVVITVTCKYCDQSIAKGAACPAPTSVPVGIQSCLQKMGGVNDISPASMKVIDSSALLSDNIKTKAEKKGGLLNCHYSQEDSAVYEMLGCNGHKPGSGKLEWMGLKVIMLEPHAASSLRQGQVWFHPSATCVT